MIPNDTHLQIGSLLFEGVDQIDLTGPFEVLSRIPNSTYRIYGKTAEPVRDLKGLRLTAGRDAGRCATTGRPSCAGRLWPGGPDGRCRGPRMDSTAGRGRAQHLLGVHRRAAFRRRWAAARESGRRRTGLRFTCCRSSALFPSTNGWSWTGIGYLPPASPRESTALCGLRPSCAATMWRRLFSSTWPTPRSRPSTAARRKPRRPRFSRRYGSRPLRSPQRREATARRVAAALGIVLPAAAD